MIKNNSDICAMIWLASFPRSGNTFIRNVLYEVYGIDSSTYHKDNKRKLDKDFSSFQVVKTHLLPSELPPKLSNHKSVYIIRDGRDSLISIAHHRKDIVDVGSDYYNNLLLATLAMDGSYFGGWSKNVQEWTAKADIIIRFEDLIEDPIREIEKLRAIIDLPQPNLEKLPTFQQLKQGKPKFGGGNEKEKRKGLAQKHFRKGKTGNWQAEMPPELHRLFWQIHGPVMREWGYTQDEIYVKQDVPKKVLIDATKAYMPDNDGVKRYTLELLEHFNIFLKYNPHFEIDILFQSTIRPLSALAISIKTQHHVKNYENVLLRIKKIVQQNMPRRLYDSLSEIYRQGPFRRFLKWVNLTVNRKQQQRQYLAFQKKLESYDCIHVLLPQHYASTSHVKVPHIVTVHDITHKLFPDFHTQDNNALAEQGMQLIQQHQPALIAISNATQQDLVTHYQCAPENITVIYEGANGSFDKRNRLTARETLLSKYHLPNKPYLLTLSTVEPRKNLKTVIAAFRQLKREQPDLDAMLVIGGKKGWKSDELFQQEKQFLQEDIYFTGFVDDADLPSLYTHALALCYVSLYEGFGLPLVEAMQCGTPVIFADNSAMPEVVGQGGLPVNAYDIDSIKGAMDTMINDPHTRAAIAAEAWPQASKFSWVKTAFETLNTYEQVMDKGR